MAKVKLSKSFTMSLDEVREGIQKLADGLQEQQGMKYEWKGSDRIEFSHKSAKGFLQIEGNELVLELKLSMLYAAMASTVKKKITELADEHVT